MSLQQQSARERAALWLAVNKLDVLEAAKDAAIKELQVCDAVGTLLMGSGFAAISERLLATIESFFLGVSHLALYGLSGKLGVVSCFTVVVFCTPPNRKLFLGESESTVLVGVFHCSLTDAPF